MIVQVFQKEWIPDVKVFVYTWFICRKRIQIVSNIRYKLIFVKMLVAAISSGSMFDSQITFVIEIMDPFKY